MDVTPRELRDLDIREKFRGYDPNDVDDLLERAARSIEQLEGQVRDLQTRADAGAVDTAKVRESEETIQRTLILAQRAADEAVAEAQGKARQILETAETKASSLVDEAETTARRQAETERRRLEGEVLELGAKRDALAADIEALEQFESDYRARLRRSVETDLEQLTGKASVAPSPRPTVHNVAMPTPAAAAFTTPTPTPAPETAPEPPAAPEPFPAAPVVQSPVFDVPPAPPAPPAPVTEAATPPAPDPTPERTASDVPWEEEVAAPPAAMRAPLFDSDPEPEHLDDDAFFASLREAVTDETPLGPRDDPSGLDDDARGGLFRRRGR